MRQASDYTALVRKKEDDGFVSYEAVLKEFGRSVAFEASSPDAALSGAYEIGGIVIDDMLSDGETLPEVEPEKPWESYSGKVTLRMPRSLHYKLHILAEDEGVSLNSLIMKILAEGAEHRHCQIRPVMSPQHINQQLVINAFENPGGADQGFDPFRALGSAKPSLQLVRTYARSA